MDGDQDQAGTPESRLEEAHDSPVQIAFYDKEDRQQAKGWKRGKADRSSGKPAVEEVDETEQGKTHHRDIQQHEGLAEIIFGEQSVKKAADQNPQHRSEPFHSFSANIVYEAMAVGQVFGIDKIDKGIIDTQVRSVAHQDDGRSQADKYQDKKIFGKLLQWRQVR